MSREGYVRLKKEPRKSMAVGSRPKKLGDQSAQSAPIKRRTRSMIAARIQTCFCPCQKAQETAKAYGQNPPSTSEDAPSKSSRRGAWPRKKDVSGNLEVDNVPKLTKDLPCRLDEKDKSSNVERKKKGQENTAAKRADSSQAKTSECTKHT